MKTWERIVFFFIFLIYIEFTNAQTNYGNVVIDLETVVYSVDENGKQYRKLNFENAVFFHNSPNMPYFFKRVSYLNNSINVTPEFYLENVVYEKLSEEEKQCLDTSVIGENISLKTLVMAEQKKTYAVCYMMPIRKNKQTGLYEILKTADLWLKSHLENKKQTSSINLKSIKSASVLAQGTFYKIAVSNTGIHKVTGADLQDMGINISNLSSANIALFGNGGGVLPEKNDEFRYQDLMENAIQVYDGGDGLFQKNDYFLFYAKGPVKWEYSATTSTFSHIPNIYDDNAYYFINVESGVGSKLRIQNADNETRAATHTISTYYQYEVIDLDTLNLGNTGRDWFRDIFDVQTSYTYSFNFPNIDITQKGVLKTTFAYASSSGSSMSIVENGNLIAQTGLSASASSVLAQKNTITTTFIPSSTSLNFVFTYNKASSASKAYMDFVEVQAVCKLQKTTSHFLFSNPDSVGVSKVAEYKISQATSTMQVWDVTTWIAPQKISYTLSGSMASYKYDASEIKYFVAFDGETAYSVEKIGKIANQNLHGIAYADMIIVSHSDFITEANRLAAFRKNNDQLSVVVVTPQMIYNEFSSGAQDISAIRDFLKYLYDKNTVHLPKYLLLFGRPSYDYRQRNMVNKLYVPNYQSALSTQITETLYRANDDFFGLLDDGEGDNCVGFIDVAVGRFPVKTLSEAVIAVDKTINYSTSKKLDTESSDQILVSNYGQWRNIMAFVADDGDAGIHLTDADNYAQIVQEKNKGINIDKIYSDAYKQESNSGGQRYPDVNEAINQRMERGALVFTYVGHGGGNGWATERILELSDISKWTNYYNQPLMVTLTCSFGWYDRPATSPAEAAFLNSKGGCVAFITTSRVAYTGSNYLYGKVFFEKIFTKNTSQQYYTIAELNMLAKNENGGTGNQLDMIYVMGDPSMRLAYPKYIVKTDSINHQLASDQKDTIHALSKVEIQGRICQENGALLSDFNGYVYPVIYDKSIKVHTLENDADCPKITFELQKNLIFKGKSSVKNGVFKCEFMVPKDINYDLGYGKISYYAQNNDVDATGYYDSLLIGGMSKDTINDTQGPEIELFMNDEKFVNGGMTGTTPLFIAKIADEYGVNTTGNGIGHDMTAILDGETNNAIVLNDYYEAETDSYQKGSVRYKISELTEGEHHLKFRAWDILNNMGESELDFTVSTSATLALYYVLNYPNPFTTQTAFYFEHNKPNVEYEISIQIFTISGKLIKTILTHQVLTSYRSDPIEWDGRDDYGDKIGRGVYIYRIRVKSSDGEIAEKIEKVVIL